jgi:hypothetical protein
MEEGRGYRATLVPGDTNGNDELLHGWFQNDPDSCSTIALLFELMYRMSSCLATLTPHLHLLMHAYLARQFQLTLCLQISGQFLRKFRWNPLFL